MPHRLKAALAILVLAAGLPAAVVAASRAPMDVIRSFYGTLLKTMQDGPKLGYKGRFEQLMPAIEQTFNIPAMAQASVGSYWDRMSEEQRKGLIAAFHDFTIANYAHSFDDYSGEKFETTSEKETPRNDTIVYSTLVKSDGDKVVLNYLLRQDGDAYKVIDVFLEGSISQLATRRAEYTSLIRQSGVDALIAAIKKKTADLAS